MRIKELREENKLTQQQVAQAINGTQSNLAKWEKGIVQPTADAIIRLSEFFNVSADYLLGRTDELGTVIMPSSSSALTDEEEQLLKLFRGMSHPQKIRLLAYGEGLIGAEASSRIS